MIEEAAAIAAISMTICRGSLFWRLQKYRLFKCPYCLSHWLAFIAAASSTTLKNFVINSFCLVTISTLFSFIILLFLKELDHN